MGMSPSIYQEFENAKAVARARLWPSWSRYYPALRPDRWYPMWDVGQDSHGVFLTRLKPRRGSSGDSTSRSGTSSRPHNPRAPNAAGTLGLVRSEPVEFIVAPLAVWKRLLYRAPTIERATVRMRA